jgi:arsenate reductase-like glutaredoxin family protein
LDWQNFMIPRTFATKTTAKKLKKKVVIDPVVLVRHKLRDAKKQAVLHVANRPSMPKQAYILFSQDERTTSPDLYRKDMPPRTMITEVARELSQRYRNLSPDRQAYYNSLAAANSASYKAAMEAWKAALTAEERSLMRRVKFYQHRLDKLTGKQSPVRKPALSTMAYIEFFKSKTKQRPPGTAVTEWAKQVGVEWKALGDQDKTHWRQVAAIH